MTNLINKAASSVASVVLFLVGAVMAGMSLAVVFLLAMFALAVAGLALLAAPFLRLAMPAAPEADDTAKAAPAAA